MSDPNQYPPAPAAQPGRPPQRPAPAPPRPPGRAGDAPAWTSKARPVLDVAARILCLALGAALLIAGLVGLFTGITQGQLVTVLIVGFLLVLMPAIVDRLRSLKTGHFEIRLVRQVADNARKSAEALRRLGMEYELDSYATIYTELRGSGLTEVRGQILDRILQRVSNAAVVEKFDQGEIKDMFMNGSPIVRVLALGLMEGDLSLIDGSVLLEAVSRPLTGNEQYHALKLVRDGWGRLSPDQRAQLLTAIDSRPPFTQGRGREELVQQIRGLAGSPRIG